jgi:hypothetical protein
MTTVQTTKLTILILTVATILSCSNRVTPKLNQSIFLFKDKDGLYQYEPTTEKEIIIFKASDKQVFLDEPYQLSNDTLTFGFKGELTFVYTSEYTKTEKYYKDYFSVDLKSRKNWLSKKILYEIKEQTLNIKTLSVDIKGKTSVLADTSMVYHSSNTTSKGITFNDLSPRFFSKHSLGDKSVFSLSGKIYYSDKSDTTLLVDYKGNFDPKFGSGYFQPQLDPKGQYAIFVYLPGFLNFKKNRSIQKVNIQTKKIEILKTGVFGEPTFSADGNFVLFKRDQKQGKLNTWISEIYILDLTTLHEQKISDAYSAQWKQ